MSILVTGASGFVGQALCMELKNRSERVRCAVRKPLKLEVQFISENSTGVFEYITVGEIGPTTDWNHALKGIDVIIHLAAMVHIMNCQDKDALSLYRRVNTLGTERLARMAADNGVRRFVYVSSIKVNGEKTFNSPFTENNEVNPQGPYAISKWEAEQILHRIADTTDLEIVILRPPLIYGPGVRGNFLRLLHLVYKGVPLPFGNVCNQRSLLGLGNFVDLLLVCSKHPRAAGETFLVSDGKDLSTPELIRYLACVLERKPRLLPFSSNVLRLIGRILGREMDMERLLSSLTIDSSKVRRILNWIPPFSVEDGLESTARWYLTKFLVNV